MLPSPCNFREMTTGTDPTKILILNIAVFAHLLLNLFLRHRSL